MFIYLFCPILLLFSLFEQAKGTMAFELADTELATYLITRHIGSLEEALTHPISFYADFYKNFYQLPEPSSSPFPLKVLLSEATNPFKSNPQFRLYHLVYSDILARLLGTRRKEYFAPRVWENLRTGRRWDAFGFLARMDFKLETTGDPRPTNVKDALTAPTRFYDFELVKQGEDFSWLKFFNAVGNLPVHNFGNFSTGLSPYPLIHQQIIAGRMKLLHTQIIHVFSSLDDLEEL